jgi:ABC-type amino acid transport substrate-binding protein
VFPAVEYGYPEQSIFVATTTPQGRLDSPMTRVAEVLLERAGVPWRSASYPASRLFANLQSGVTAFSILVRGAQLDTCCLVSRQPIFSTYLNVYSIDDKPGIQSRDQLLGRRVITIRGYTYGTLLKFLNDPANRIVNEVAGTHRAGFDMLAAQRGDYLIDYAPAASAILAESPLGNLRIQSLERLDIYLAVSRAYPEAERLLARLEEIAAKIDIPAMLPGLGGTR